LLKVIVIEKILCVKFCLNYFLLYINFTVKPFKKIFNYETTEWISKENFIKFFDVFLEKLRKHTPFIIKITLKLVNEYVKKIFKIEPDNISPLYTSYIFNFIMSPRIMDYYDISPSKFLTIRTINRLIRVKFIFNKKY